MHARNVHKVARELVWIVALVALVVGAVLGRTLAHEPLGDATHAVLGRAWRGDAAETRGVLGGMLGFEITVLTLILSLNAMVMKGAAYQYFASSSTSPTDRSRRPRTIRTRPGRR